MDTLLFGCEAWDSGSGQVHLERYEQRYEL